VEAKSVFVVEAYDENMNEWCSISSHIHESSARREINKSRKHFSFKLRLVEYGRGDVIQTYRPIIEKRRNKLCQMRQK
jgi:hypothetical protein